MVLTALCYVPSMFRHIGVEL